MVLTDTADNCGKPGFVSIGVLLVNKAVSCRPIQKTGYLLIKLQSFVFTGCQAQLFYRCPESAAFAPVALARFGGSFHPLDTRLMKWHYFVPLNICNPISPDKFNLLSKIVNS